MEDEGVGEQLVVADVVEIVRRWSRHEWLNQGGRDVLREGWMGEGCGGSGSCRSCEVRGREGKKQRRAMGGGTRRGGGWRRAVGDEGGGCGEGGRRGRGGAFRVLILYGNS